MFEVQLANHNGHRDVLNCEVIRLNTCLGKIKCMRKNLMEKKTFRELLSTFLEHVHKANRTCMLYDFEMK